MVTIKIDGQVNALLSNLELSKVAHKSIASIVEDYCNGQSGYVTICISNEKANVSHRAFTPKRRGNGAKSIEEISEDDF